MKRLTFAAMALLLLVGCTTHGRLGALPEVPTDAAEMVVIRPSGFVGCGQPLTVTVDGHEVYGLSCGEHVILPVPAGERIIGVQHRTWFVADENTTALTVAAHRRYYLRLDVQSAAPVLSRITEHSGLPLMAKTTRVR